MDDRRSSVHPLTGDEFLIELYLDFGPDYFGVPYPSANTIGFTSVIPDTYQKLDIFTTNLQERATTPQQKAVFNGLPSQIATDFDGTSALGLTSAGRYAVGFPPLSKFVYAMGFNSNAKFDFDPRDGIDADKLDFEALFTRELGRVLGFLSDVGAREMNPLPRRSEPGGSFFSLPTFWDWYRVRPGATMETFATALRPQLSGGEQIFFTGDLELPLSTGVRRATGKTMR
jgi:hypothetical protein